MTARHVDPGGRVRRIDGDQNFEGANRKQNPH